MFQGRFAGVQSQPVDTERIIRLERVLALSRLSLSMLALIVLGLELPTETHAGAVARFIAAYTGYAFVVAVLVGFVPRQPFLSRIVHAADICWAVAITSATEGPGGTFFVFVVFVLVSAAYRGGLRHALVSGVTTALLLLTSAVVLPLESLGLPPPLGPDQLLIRCGYAMGLAGLISDGKLNNMTVAIPQVVLACCVGDLNHVFNGYLDRIRHGDRSTRARSRRGRR